MNTRCCGKSSTAHLLNQRTLYGITLAPYSLQFSKECLCSILQQSVELSAFSFYRFTQSYLPLKKNQQRSMSTSMKKAMPGIHHPGFGLLGLLFLFSYY